MRYQFGTSSSWGGRRTAPYAFTEQGVAMLSSVLRSERAVQVNVEIMRTFVRFRRLLTFEAEVRQRLEMLEATLQVHDTQIDAVFDAIRQMMAPSEDEARRIGFRLDGGPDAG